MDLTRMASAMQSFSLEDVMREEFRRTGDPDAQTHRAQLFGLYLGLRTSVGCLQHLQANRDRLTPQRRVILERFEADHELERGLERVAGELAPLTHTAEILSCVERHRELIHRFETRVEAMLQAALDASSSPPAGS
jgi:hypothetical protein